MLQSLLGLTEASDTESNRPYGTASFGGLSLAVNCQATIIPSLRDNYRSVKLLAVLRNIHFSRVVPLNDEEIADRQNEGGKPPDGGNPKTKVRCGAVSGG